MSYIAITRNERVIQMFLRLGVSPIVVTDTKMDTTYPRSHEDLLADHPDIDIRILPNMTEIKSLTDLAGDLGETAGRIEGIYNCVEITQYAGALLGSLLSVPDASLPRVQQSRDKRVMKRNFQVHGVPIARGRAVSLPVADGAFEELRDDLGCPFILKPIDGRSSKDIWKIEDAHGYASWLARTARPSAPRHWIAEEHITGEEYHIDAIWRDGEVRYLFVGHYERPPGLVASGNGSNATVYLPQNKHAALYDMAGDLNDRIGAAIRMRTGVTHSEFFLRPDGTAVVGEVATRAAGGAHDDCIRVLLGEGLKELSVRSLLDRWDRAPTADATADRYVGFVNLVPVEDGQLTALPARDDLLAVPGVVDVSTFMKLGDPYTKAGACSWCVMPLVEAASEAECHAAFRHLRETFAQAVVTER